MGKQRRYCLACCKEPPEEAAEVCPACGNKLHVLPDDDLSGTLLDGRYRMLRQVGRGGMGIVYKGRHEALDRTVAIKVLRPELAPDEQFVKRFLLEARAVARLRNPHTVMVHDFGSAPPGFLYFVMEFCEGISLLNVLRRKKRLPWQQAARIGAQVCESLSEAHAQGIFHRDIKPENIFLVPGADGKEHTKVLDFGIAKLASAGEGTRLTRKGLVVGTPEYLSPEQASDGKLDARSDLYSLGVVLYEMVAGQRPFEAESTATLLVMHLQKVPPPFPQDVPLSPTFAELVLSCLSKDPEKRPESAQKLGAMLREVVDGRQVANTMPLPAGPPPETRKEVPEPQERGTRAYEERDEPQKKDDAGPPSKEGAGQQEGESSVPEIASRHGMGQKTYLEMTKASTAMVPAILRRGWLPFGVGAILLAVVVALTLVLVGVFPDSGSEPGSPGRLGDERASSEGGHGLEAKPSLPSPGGVTRSTDTGVGGSQAGANAQDRDVVAAPGDVRGSGGSSGPVDAGPGADVVRQREVAGGAAPPEDAAPVGKLGAATPDVVSTGETSAEKDVAGETGAGSKTGRPPETKGTVRTHGISGTNSTTDSGKPPGEGEGKGTHDNTAGGQKTGEDFGDLPDGTKPKGSDFGDVPPTTREEKKK